MSDVLTNAHAIFKTMTMSAAAAAAIEHAAGEKKLEAKKLSR